MTTHSQILLVDDDSDLLHLLSLRLNSAGYEVSVAKSAEEALVLMSLIHPDLVITDLRMEEMDGMALYDSIREQNTSLPVIILTAHGSIPDAVEATKRGVFAFLTKPLNGKDLLAQVQKALTLSGAAKHRSDHDKNTEWRQEIVSQSKTMEDLLSRAKLVADSGSNILIQGESGTGKELLAKAIHKASVRKDNPFIPVNCGAIPEALLESELFGHTKGSFTGATRNYEGLFRSAHGGTLFLDEIGDTPLSIQVKLLRVLQEKSVRPVGSSQADLIDVRILSATNRDLEDAIAEGNFRQDLYYRLNVVSLEIPSLIQRREDIPLLAAHFLKTISDQTGKKVNGFAPEAMEQLLTAPWPGNVRQLQNSVEHAVALTTTPLISADLLRSTIQEDTGKVPSFSEARKKFEQDYLVNLLMMTKGNVSQAARIAKRNRTDFYKLLQRNHIVPALFKS